MGGIRGGNQEEGEKRGVEGGGGGGGEGEKDVGIKFHTYIWCQN